MVLVGLKHLTHSVFFGGGRPEEEEEEAVIGWQRSSSVRWASVPVCSVSCTLPRVHLPESQERFLIHITKLTSRKVTTVYASHCCVYGIQCNAVPATSQFYDLE